MPAFGDRLPDTEVAALLPYLRASINETGDPVAAKAGARIRGTYADRQQAWTSDELQTDGAPPSPSREENR